MMADVIEWANGNGWTVKLTVSEARELLETLEKHLLYTFVNLEDEIEFELEKK